MLSTDLIHIILLYMQIFTKDFELVLPDGSTATEVNNVSSTCRVTSTTISSSSDLATCSFVLASSAGTAKCTAILKAAPDGEWKLALVQLSQTIG
jgi:hypothetical protein